MKVAIDPEFSKLIPNVPAEHDAELEQAILADGRFLNPLILWKHKGILLDGYRRHRIHTKHPSLKMPAPVVLDFETRDEAHDWIIRHQLSKRNITDEQRRYLVGKLYIEKRRPRGNPQFSSGNCNSAAAAELDGVPDRTARSNAEFAEAIDAVKDVAPIIADGVLAGDVKASTKDLQALAATSKRNAKKAEKAIAGGEAKTIKAALGAKIETGGTSERQWGEGDSLDDVQADLKELNRRCRELSKFARTILRCEENDIKRPFCGNYSLLTLSHPLLHVARCVMNDLPVGGTPKKPILFHEEKAASLAK